MPVLYNTININTKETKNNFSYETFAIDLIFTTKKKDLIA